MLALRQIKFISAHKICIKDMFTYEYEENSLRYCHFDLNKILNVMSGSIFGVYHCDKIEIRLKIVLHSY